MPARAIDWEAIKRRLAAAAAALSAGLDHRPEATRVLEARARAAARPPAPRDDTERLMILAFSLADETYGVETRYVREVSPLRDLTPVPCTPAFVAGVVNHRGRILAVVDLRQLLGLPARGLTQLDRIIVLENGEDEFGLLADSIDGVRSEAACELTASETTLPGRRFLKGVTRQMLCLLDGARLLADTSLKVSEQVSQ